jgi:hypothetical protein
MKNILLGFAAMAVLSACGNRAESEARNIISEKLVDPDSAELRSVFKGKSKKDGYNFICGELNSKNRMGGYNGFVPFLILFGVDGETREPELIFGDNDDAYATLVINGFKQNRPDDAENCPF